MHSILTDVSIRPGRFVSDLRRQNVGAYDFESLYSKLLAVKKSNPEIFQIDLIPAKNVAYKDIVKIMDEARQSHDNRITFPVFDEKKGQTVETNYMFPEIVFVNMTEG